jgi:predicted RNase H-like nuclease (RuvC/YqgF family)
MNICKRFCRFISKWAWEDKIEQLECEIIKKHNSLENREKALESLQEDLNDSNLNIDTLSTNIKILKLQNKKITELFESNYIELLEVKKDKIFGIEIKSTSNFLNDEQVKVIIKESGTRARTLFNLDYDVQLLDISNIKEIVEIFDFDKIPNSENPALHLKSVFEATKFSGSAFGIARNKDIYFNIFIGNDKKLYTIDLKNKLVQEYNSEHRFTQYWI